MQLVIGNKNYSSWSLRAWLLLRHFELPFDEVRIPLFTPDYRELLARYTPNLKVPVLIDEELQVWESLAICEYINERYLDGRALPNGREARALCRSVCHEMHAGFPAIRRELPMNCRARRRLTLSSAVQAEVRRIDSLWTRCRRRFEGQGDYLFGHFGMADCLYAPMVLRFRTYGVELSDYGATYSETLLANPALRQWLEEAEAEEERLPRYELGIDVRGASS